MYDMGFESKNSSLDRKRYAALTAYGKERCLLWPTMEGFFCLEAAVFQGKCMEKSADGLIDLKLSAQARL